MNKRALVYLALASATLAGVFVFLQLKPGADAALAPATGQAESLNSIVISGGQLNGEPVRLQAKAGGVAEFLVFSDQADQLHVHGIDQTVDLAAGQGTKVRIPTPIAGEYELELLDADIIIGVLDVQP